VSETGPPGPGGSDRPTEPLPDANPDDRTVEPLPFMGRLLAPATAVGVVIVVILLLVWINGGSAGNGQSPAAVGAAPAGARAVVPLTRSHTPTAAATPSTTTATASPTPTALPTTHSHPNPARTAMAVVTVLNNSTRVGLAHAVAAQVQAKGWKTGLIGNLRGLVAESTVYYAPGYAAAARHLAHDFGSIRRVESNRSGNIHGMALTLVVTRYWTL
jgi:hypothetical protein